MVLENSGFITSIIHMVNSALVEFRIMNPKKSNFLIFLVFLQFVSIFTRDISPVVVYDVMVMKNKLPESVAEYRIPILAIGPLDNTLVMFAEARLTSSSDHSPKNIVYKYSTDNGFTWLVTLNLQS